ncbi:hypothetical protein [Lentzea nigeriaca]|uniref:hypothetical protein n=1 Tax=Lentzea nigeriaca TaxID=1128665 RepID=UPI00195A60B2|nr:hypothetical protein [Lentzea nigeriaca]MBM7863108.1 hypothetical protein [Lentzea nigeriaca]
MLARASQYMLAYPLSWHVSTCEDIPMPLARHGFIEQRFSSTSSSSTCLSSSVQAVTSTLRY